MTKDMTREEAVNILNRDDDSMRKGYFCINDFKAIEVLKSEEFCEDAVSRAEVLKGYIEIELADGVEIYSDKAVPIEYINNLPSVTPTRKKGKWIEIKNKNRTVIALRCDCCGKSPKHAIRSLYCPNCGTKMEV